LSGSYSLFPGVYLAEEVDGLGDKGSGNITIFDLQTLLEEFLGMSLRSACSVYGNFLVEHALQFWDHSAQVWIIRISEILNVGLKEFAVH
jgi:hypothetical protein